LLLPVLGRQMSGYIYHHYTSNSKAIIAAAILVAIVFALGKGNPPASAAPVTTAGGDSATAPASSSKLPTYGYRIVKTYPHDAKAFTQGLVYEDGFLYEGTGICGESSLRKVELDTGTILKQQPLSSSYFGEGITIWRDRIIQLTWQSHVGFVYDKKSFQLLSKFNYPTEGWGITTDGKKLIMSDGTSLLTFLDPNTFQKIGQMEVRAKGVLVENLNELEYINGEIYANVWKTDRIARISPTTGRVTGWIDLSGLSSKVPLSNAEDVLNGIAYDAKLDRLFVTGKHWPKLFEIELVAR